MAAALGREVLAIGSARTLEGIDGLDEAVTRVEGIVVTPDVWAGLDRTPHADAGFIARLDDRLQWGASGIGFKERGVTLDWRTWEAAGATARWERSAEGRLWRASTRFGGYQFVWTAGGHPANSEYLELTLGEADRARFALANKAGKPLVGRYRNDDRLVRLGLSFPLPRPEYRYLSLYASRAEDRDGERAWNADPSAADTIRAILTERLGVQWQGEGGIARNPELPPGNESTGPTGEAEPDSAEKGESAPGPYDEWTVTSVISLLPRRMLNLIGELDFPTVGALKEWHRIVDPADVRGYGRRLHEELGTALNRLEAEGYEALAFQGASPKSIEELAKRYLAQLKPRERRLLELRYVHGLNLEPIGKQEGVTRERVRQIIERELSAARPSWGVRARELLEPAIVALDDRGGIALVETVLDQLAAPPAWAVAFACVLADTDIILDVTPGIATTLTKDEFLAIRRDLRRELAVLPDPIPVRAVQDVLSASGMSIPARELPSLADSLLAMTIDGDMAYPNRRSVQYLFLEVLREAGGPISAEDVARRVNELDPLLAATKVHAVVHFSRVHHVFNHSHGKWIHEEFLPVSLDRLNELARSCLPEIERASGQAVNVRLLLQALVARGDAPAELTPNVLRDALIHTRKVRGWFATTDVAWLGGEIARKTIGDWTAEVASELDQPFAIAELVSAVAERSGHLVSSVAVQAHEAQKTLVPVGRGRYVSRHQVWSDEVAYSASLRQVENALSGRTLCSAESAGLDTSPLADLTARFGRGIVWGLASKVPGITTRELGMFMWQTMHGATLWRVIADQFLVHNQVFRLSGLRDYLRRVGVISEHVVSRVLNEGLSEGYVGRIGMRWYLDNQASVERQVDLLDGQPEIRQLALGSQDFVRESPFREALNEVRVRHGSFRIPAG
ncbi:MAG: sigma factor-like helix-turn-helix DNA-binding protein [Gemmatimonadales bacterium]